MVHRSGWNHHTGKRRKVQAMEEIPTHGKGRGMSIRDLFLTLALLALLGLAIAISSGCFGGPSDLDAFRMSAEPFKSQP